MAMWTKRRLRAWNMMGFGVWLMGRNERLGQLVYRAALRTYYREEAKALNAETAPASLR